jgi:tetratricopeptide (TPR) repeat protein
MNRAIDKRSRGLVLWLAALVSAGAGAAVDLGALWDFSRPEVSEQRFRAALATAQGDDAFILHTQIARTHGLRKDFESARAVLKEIEPQLATAGAEAQVRYWLELGRSHASATHTKAQLTPEAIASARDAFDRALARARSAKLDGLAIDAIHMYAFIDTAPADQLKWGREALAVSLASSQADARAWEASIRNNVGLALHRLGRYPEALDEFQIALKLREQGGSARSVRIAKWMIAWTLRALKRDDEALQMQLALERDSAAAGQPDPYVFEELETLYRNRGDEARAQHYATLRRK